jgi:hypothetical protein
VATTYFCIPSSVMKNNNGNAVRTSEPLNCTYGSNTFLYPDTHLKSKDTAMNEIGHWLLTV